MSKERSRKGERDEGESKKGGERWRVYVYEKGSSR